MSGHVILIEKNPQYIFTFTSYLQQWGYVVTSFEDLYSALLFLKNNQSRGSDVVIIGETALGEDIYAKLSEVKFTNFGQIPIILVAFNYPNNQQLSIVLKSKVDSIILYDDDILRLKFLINRLLIDYRLRNKTEFSLPYTDTSSCVYFSNFYESSEISDPIIPKLKKYSKSDSNLLIEGEDGTGKSLCAHIIHCESSRADMKFGIFNASRIAEQDIILEEAKLNWQNNIVTQLIRDDLSEISGGTFYIKNIDLLSLLQLRYFLFVIKKLQQSFDFRLICSSNNILKNNLPKSKYTREILLFLSEDYLYLPPLRQRRTEISKLANFLLENFAKQDELSHITHINNDILQQLEYQEWEGNVAQLAQMIYRAMSNSSNTILGLDDFPQLSNTISDNASQIALDNDETASKNGYISIYYDNSKKVRSLSEIEQSILTLVLAEKNNSISATAKALKVSRSTIYRKLAFYNLLPLS